MLSKPLTQPPGGVYPNLVLSYHERETSCYEFIITHKRLSKRSIEVIVTLKIFKLRVSRCFRADTDESWSFKSETFNPIIVNAGIDSATKLSKTERSKAGPDKRNGFTPKLISERNSHCRCTRSTVLHCGWLYDNNRKQNRTVTDRI